jgi:ABC-2 type transport system ATP-binding protein
VRWIRNLLKGLAEEGRTVFLSSHLMSEMALTADHVIVVGKGRLLLDQSMAEFIAAASSEVVRVRSPHADQLAGLLAGAEVTVRSIAQDTLEVQGLSSDQIGTSAAGAGITLWELATQAASLEEAYMALTEDSIDYRSSLEDTEHTEDAA